MKYRPDIDGLRAVAILSVLFFHADVGVRGGYVGVDVFFVISGFLITGLILKDLDRGEFRIVEFWDRRIRRILPAMLLVVACGLIVGWVLLMPRHFKELGQSVLAQALLVSNMYFWKKSGYFDPGAELRPLFHTWSLAVEEQFYIAFPFLLIVLTRLGRLARLIAMVLLCIGSLLLCIYCSYKHTIANFYFLPMRAWELLLGAILAALPAQSVLKRWPAEVLSVLGLTAILAAAVLYDGNTRFPGTAALLPCGGAALLIFANAGQLTAVGKLLSLRPVVFIGLISYSLYLWHWPVLVYGRYVLLGPPSLGLRLGFMLASIVLAIISWHFVETPFRKRKILKSRARVFAFAGATAVGLMVAGFTIDKAEGVPQRLSPDALRYAQGVADRAFIVDLTLEQVRNEEFIELGAGDKSRPVEVVVWGDSHAMAAMPAIDALCTQYAIRGVAATHSSQVPFVGYESNSEEALMEESIPFNDAIVDFVRKKHVGDVILIGSWQGCAEYDRGTDRLRRGLVATIAALKDAGSRIWVMKDTPHQNFDVPKALALAVLAHHDPEGLGLPIASQRQAESFMAPIFDGIVDPSVTFLDPTDLFLSDRGICRVAAGGYALYRDNHHLSARGAMTLRPLFEPVFTQIRKSRAAATQP